MQVFIQQIYLTSLAGLAQLKQTDAVVFNKHCKLHPHDRLLVIVGKAFCDLDLLDFIARYLFNELSSPDASDSLLPEVVLKTNNSPKLCDHIDR